MKMRRLYILLAVWLLLLTAPAVLTMLGVFGHVDAHTSISGHLALCWVMGYLAQFGVFMWIMSMVDNQKLLATVIWWFSASLLPWALDWTPSGSPLFLLWFPASIGLAFWIAVSTRSADDLQQHGIRATGVVLEVLKPWMNMVINNVYIKRKVRLRIERSDGAQPYEAFLNGLFMLGEIPSPGDRMSVIVDPAKPQHVEYDKSKDKDADANADAAAASAAYAATTRREPPPSTDRSRLGEELERLASLHERGALTDTEFAAAKRKLLRE